MRSSNESSEAAEDPAGGPSPAESAAAAEDKDAAAKEGCCGRDSFSSAVIFGEEMSLPPNSEVFPCNILSARVSLKASSGLEGAHVSVVVGYIVTLSGERGDSSPLMSDTSGGGGGMESGGGFSC